MIRHCQRCKATKPVEAFGKNRKVKDGIHVWCLECARAYSRMRRLDPENREKDRLYARERRKLPEVKARLKITDAEHLARYPERRRAIEQSEGRRATIRKYINKPEVKARQLVIRADRRAAKLSGGGVSAEHWAEVLERFNHRCAYCLTDGSLQMDHLIPLSRGGPHDPGNVIPACRPCNQSKGNRDLLWFLAHSSRRREVA
jgi:5-methylcytosine-specific restriction endonuclease McrA